jgi:hypothetical protein
LGVLGDFGDFGDVHGEEDFEEELPLPCLPPFPAVPLTPNSLTAIFFIALAPFGVSGLLTIPSMSMAFIRRKRGGGESPNLIVVAFDDREDVDMGECIDMTN